MDQYDWELEEYFNTLEGTDSFSLDLEIMLRARSIVESDNTVGIAPDFTEPGDIMCQLVSSDRSQDVLRLNNNGTHTYIGDTLLLYKAAKRLGTEEIRRRVTKTGTILFNILPVKCEA
jgi:hypothetical protein